MVIRPSDSDHSRKPSAAGADASAAQRASRRAVKPEITPPVQSPAHDAQVSRAARELIEALSSAAPPSASMSPERTRTVLDRIRTGHYDRPEVLEQVADKVQADLTPPGADV